MRYTIFKRGGYNQGTIGTTGGNVSGKLLLLRDPIGDLEASTKNYVDLKLNILSVGQFITGIMPSGRVPEFTGDMVKLAGNPNTTVKTTNVAAGSYPKVTVNLKGQVVNGAVLTDADIPSLSWSKIVAGKPLTLLGYGINNALNTSGGTFTGTFKVSENGLDPESLINKSYIDTSVSASAGVSAGGMVYRNEDVTPIGFLRCNGGLVSKITYPVLYSVIGDQYTSGFIKGFGKPWINQYGMNASGSNYGTTKISLPNLPLAGQPRMVSTNTKLYLVYPNALYVSNKDSTGLPTTWLRLRFTGGTPSTIKDAVIKDNYMYILTQDRIQGYNLSNPETVDSWSLLNFITTGIDVKLTNIFVAKGKVFVSDGYRYGIYNVSSDGSLTLFKNFTLTLPNWSQSQPNVDGNNGTLSGTKQVSFIVKDSNKVTVVMLPRVTRPLSGLGQQSITFSGSLIVTYTAEIDSNFNFTNITTPEVKLTTGSFSSYPETSTYNSQTFYTTRDLALEMIVSNDAIYFIGGGRVTAHFYTAGSSTNYGPYYEQDRYILRSTIDALGVVSTPALLNSSGGFYNSTGCISNRRLLIVGGTETGTQYPVAPNITGGGVASLSLIGTAENTSIPILDYDNFITGDGVSFVDSNFFYLPYVVSNIPETYVFIKY